MVCNYAIKSIVIVDFIDIDDIASASPLMRESDTPNARMFNHLRISTGVVTGPRCTGLQFGGKILRNVRRFPVNLLPVNLGVGIGRDAQHLKRDVVRSAPLPSQFHQGGTALGWSVGGHGGFQFFVGHNTPKAVRA